MSDSDLGEILRRSVAVLAPNADEKQIEIRVAASEPQPVWADADRIQEVITNLVGNAVKFCSPGGRIEVKLERATTSGPRISLLGEYVLVTVEDTGLGMVPEVRERVFEKFYQGTKSRSIGPGTGLGLAISKEIVLHHRGEIWVESEPGVGSRFYFTLPLAGPRDVVESPSPRSQPEEES
jgi:signal transduction histidine kinase